jgi:hypothetical protein
MQSTRVQVHQATLRSTISTDATLVASGRAATDSTGAEMPAVGERERVRVGRALRQLPEIERAFVDGELSYSRVREVTRVATTQSEPGWLELARGLDMRSLERRVAAEREAAGANSDRHDEPHQPARTQWVGPGRVRVTFELSAEAWALLERAMREARPAGAARPSDGEALEAVARAALSVPRADPNDTPDRVEPFRRWNRDHAEGQLDAAEHGRSIVEAGGPEEAAGGSRAAEHGMGATQGGSSENAMGATQGGSATERVMERRIDDECGGIGSEAREPALRLMRVMGRSGGWTIDALTESSGLSVPEVCGALSLLELGRRVRRRAFAFDPV